ncbi:TRAP transporter small permease [Limibaculum sp. FT325]|uniref:TRAP transporter small permease n=1 Tax=Thermohalobaculum sediminis TaxID=2939436 RepID=UPI0020BE09E6|nr:TRAP transporter small permease [Limibaculum sediminis]MCL5776976.1 TRAP transporter small permease [Limibaculum sediminis]
MSASGAGAAPRGVVGLVTRLAAAWAVAGGVVLALIVLVTTANIALFAAHRVALLWGGSVAGLPGYEDFVRLAVSAAALMLLPWCQARRGHVAVDLFVSALPGAARRGLDRLWLGCMAGLALFLAVMMVDGMAETRADGVLSPILGWPEWPFYLPGLVSLGLWALVAAVQAVLAPGGEA